MRRRTYLGTLLSLGVGSLAGCIGGSPEAANEFDYETMSVSGVEVPLAPLSDVIEWYESDDAVFVDTRHEMDFEESRIADAVLSPARDGQEENDPVEELPESTRLVTYCRCPHALATSRGSKLIEEGYAHTYALDEGFDAWIEAGYPVEGSA